MIFLVPPGVMTNSLGESSGCTPGTTTDTPFMGSVYSCSGLGSANGERLTLVPAKRIVAAETRDAAGYLEDARERYKSGLILGDAVGEGANGEENEFLNLWAEPEFLPGLRVGIVVISISSGSRTPVGGFGVLCGSHLPKEYAEMKVGQS